MLHYLAANLGTIFLSLAVLAIVVLITAKLVRDKRKGRSSCGCGCENCPSASSCHGSTK